jgi:triacylglycerol esterase/lipase EstA (alpha/beta hydrolase family)
MSQRHLIVLIHGVHGLASDFELLTKRLARRNVTPFALQCIEGETSNGIQHCGKLILASVTEKIIETDARQISIIGHGVGGLFARELIKLLYEHSIIPDIEPIAFITVGTPHLGVKSNNLTFPLFGNASYSRLDQTSKDLILQASNSQTSCKPTLIQMIEDQYIEPLKQFKTLVAYSSAAKESGYSYSSCAILNRDFEISSSENLKDTETLYLDEQLIAENNNGNADENEMKILGVLSSIRWVRVAWIGRMMLHQPGIWLSHKGSDIIYSIMNFLDLEPMESPSSPVRRRSEDSPIHVVVLIHGLDGYNTDLEYIASKLRKRHPYTLQTFTPTCNHGKTYDGIMNGAKRIRNELYQFLERIDAKYLSIVGHSLGGLYGRCLAGLLFEDKVIPDKMKPLNYISLATPHLGSRAHAKIMGERFTSIVVGAVIGQTGKGNSTLTRIDAGR